jgi:hypothetical protein
MPTSIGECSAQCGVREAAVLSHGFGAPARTRPRGLRSAGARGFLAQLTWLGKLLNYVATITLPTPLRRPRPGCLAGRRRAQDRDGEGRGGVGRRDGGTYMTTEVADGM